MGEKNKKIAIIAAVALGVMLLVAIVVSSISGLKQIKDSTNVELGTVSELKLDAKDFFEVDDDTAKKVKFDTSEVDLTKVGEYEVIAKCDGKKYTIKVIIEDTTAPKVSMAQQIVFTNDIAKFNDFSSIVKEVNDASECTYKLVRFEEKKELLEVNDLEIKNLTEGIGSIIKAEDALAVGTEEIPTTPGIYRSVLEIADESGNASYEEVIVVLDSTGAVITDVADQTVNVSKDKLGEQPEVDKSLYSATDNVDGYISGEKLNYEVTCRDEAKHEWIVKVSYTDRAGNESSGEFLITVKEKKTSGNSGSGNQNNGGASNGGGSSNGGNTSNGGNANTGNGGSSSSGGGSASNGGYDPADTDRDGTVSTSEEMKYITPEKQACIDAGYGVVCEFDGGTWFAVLVHNDCTANGKDGWIILEEYMDARGLDGNVSGSYINSANDWYWYRATNIHEKPQEFDDDYWNSL